MREIPEPSLILRNTKKTQGRLAQILFQEDAHAYPADKNMCEPTVHRGVG